MSPSLESNVRNKPNLAGATRRTSTLWTKTYVGSKPSTTSEKQTQFPGVGTNKANARRFADQEIDAPRGRAYETNPIRRPGSASREPRVTLLRRAMVISSVVSYFSTTCYESSCVLGPNEKCYPVLNQANSEKPERMLTRLRGFEIATCTAGSKKAFSRVFTTTGFGAPTGPHGPENRDFTLKEIEADAESAKSG